MLHPRLPSRAHEQVWLQDSHLEVDAGLESLMTVSLSLRQPCEEHTMITPRFGAGKQALARGRGDVGVTWVGDLGTSLMFVVAWQGEKQKKSWTNLLALRKGL